MSSYSAQLSWPKSRCHEAWLHRFVIVQDYGNYIKEMCQICGKTKTFRMDGSNLEYIKHHLRQILIKQHPLFGHEYEHNDR